MVRSGFKRFTGSFGIEAALRAVFIVGLVGLAACAARPEEAQQTRTLVPQEAVDTAAFSQTSLFEDKDDGVHTILALSAGGADGAFGAGVLAGWTESGKRPTFDVVTGVSTGALLATLAFLGPQYDDTIKQLYTTQTNSKIFRKKGLGGLFSDSLYDNEPLQKQIEEHITEQTLRDIAAEHKKGRRLYVATVNLDAGESVVWDMGGIAAGEKGGRADSLSHFRKVLRASAAVPGFFQPVYIKPRRGVQLRQAHVDGGVKEPILYARFMGNSNVKKKHLYMVVNSTTTRYNASKPVEPNLASITQKTIFELTRELQRDTIFRHYVTARTQGLKFHLTSIPDSIPFAEKSLDFNPVRMNRLYQAGLKIGKQGPDAWKTEPPSISREHVKAAMAATQ